MKQIITIFLFILSNLCFSQQIVKCRVFDKDTKKPLGYTLITSKATSIEFLADENGFFTKNISNCDDTIIVFKYLYNQAILPVKQLLNDSSIFLTLKIRKKIEVAERDIIDFKTREIGYLTQKAKGEKLKLEFGQYAEVEIKNDFKDKQVELLYVKFWIHKSFSNPLPLIVSFYEINSNGTIGKSIMKEPIIFYVRCKKTDELIKYSVANRKILIPENGVFMKIKPLAIGEEMKKETIPNAPCFYTTDRDQNLNIGLEVMIY